MISLIGLGIVAFLVLWFIFANVMTLAKHRDKIPRFLMPLVVLVALVGYLIDVAFNIVFGTLIFMQLPRHLTLSERMREILITDTAWRWGIAYFICTKCVEPWDPNHCGLEDLP